MTKNMTKFMCKSSLENTNCNKNFFLNVLLLKGLFNDKIELN